MAQDALSVANGTGVAVRQAINTAMQASATNQSGSSAPSTTYPFQFFADTNTNTLKLRNAANNAYINVSGVGQIGAANLGLLPLTGGTISGNLIVSGNLTVNGSTTTVDTTTLTVEDKNIEIGKVASPSDTTADGGGLTLLGATNKTFNWVDSTDSWTSSENIDLASGKVLKANGTQILSATNFTGTSAIATNVTVADESSDTTCNVLFTTAATGNLPPKTGTNLTFNSATGALTATSFNGDLVGGIPDDSVTSAKIVDGAIVNADVNASAAIAGTKISPDFGSQAITTTGNSSFGETVTVTGNNPNITFTDSNSNPDFKIFGSNGSFSILDSTNSATRFLINSIGNIVAGGDLTIGDISAGSGTFTDAVVHNYTSAVQAEIYDGSSFTVVGGGGGGTGGGGEQIFFESENEMNNSYTISSNHNALVAGPLTIASGATLTINSPSVVTIP